MQGTSKIKEFIKQQLQSKKDDVNRLLLKYSFLVGEKLNNTLGFMTNLTKKYPSVNAFIASALPALATEQPQIGVPLAFIYLYFQVITGGKNDEQIEKTVKTLSKEELEEGFKEFREVILGKLIEWELYIKECGIDYLPKTILEVNRDAREKDKEKFLKGLAPSWNVIIDSLDIEREEEEKIRDLLKQEKNVMLLGNSGSGKSVLMMRTAYDLMRDYAVFFSNGLINSRKAIQFISEPEFSEKKKIIFIDNATLNKPEVLNLIMNAERKSIDVNFVFAEQKERWGANKENLAVYNFKDIEIRLSKETKEKYLERYSKDKKIRDEILQMSKDSFPILVMMVSGESTNIEKIIDDMWASIKNNDKEKAVMKTIFTCSYFGVSTPEKALKEIFKDGSIIYDLSEKGLISIDKSLITTRHPVISRLILKEKYRINNATELAGEVEQFTKISSKFEYANFLFHLGTSVFASEYESRNEALILVSEKLFDKAIEINPKYAAVWYNKGTALIYLKRYEEAIECFDKAIEINPKDAAAWYNKACMYSLIKDKENSLKLLQKAIELDKQYKQEAKEDKDFDWLWDDDDFKRIVS